MSGAIIGDGDRKSLNPRAPMTNCAILTSYIRADPRTCKWLSRVGCTLPDQNGEFGEIRLQIFHSDGME